MVPRRICPPVGCHLERRRCQRRDAGNAAERIAARHRFFHWELEFPQVFFDNRGVRARTAASTRRSATCLDTAAGRLRGRAIVATKHVTIVGGLVRFNAEPRAQSDGHANRYQLFTERGCADAPGRTRCPAPPAGLAIDSRQRSAQAHAAVVVSTWTAIVGEVDNRLGAFRRPQRPLLMTATWSAEPQLSIFSRRALRHGFSLENGIHEELLQPPTASDVVITTPLLERISGDELTIPWLETPKVSVAEHAAALIRRLAANAAGTSDSAAN